MRSTRVKLSRFVRGFLSEDSLGGAAVLILQAGAELQSLQAAATLPFIISNLITHSLSKGCPADPGQSFLYALMSAGINGDRVLSVMLKELSNYIRQTSVNVSRAVNIMLSRKIYTLVKNKKNGLDKIELYAGLDKQSVINGRRYYWDLFKGECYEKEQFN